MAECHEMKLGEIYVCDACGLELKVVRECTDCGPETSSCACGDEDDHCGFSCCGGAMVKKG